MQILKFKKSIHIFKNKYYETNIEEKKIKNKFDIIFLMHTLEHFKYPARAIQNIKASLKMMVEFLLKFLILILIFEKKHIMLFSTNI